MTPVKSSDKPITLMEPFKEVPSNVPENVTSVAPWSSTTLTVLSWGVPTPASGEVNVGIAGFVVAFLAFPLVGAMIVTRRHRNAIGWLFLLVGLNLGVSDLAPTYADYAVYASPGALPAADWVGWIGGWSDPLFFMSIALVLLLFPDGGVLSRRWRPVLWLTLGAGVLAVAWNGLKPWRAKFCVCVFALAARLRASMGWVWRSAITCPNCLAKLIWI